MSFTASAAVLSPTVPLVGEGVGRNIGGVPTMQEGVTTTGGVTAMQVGVTTIQVGVPTIQE